jgi:hypothetical protein
MSKKGVLSIAVALTALGAGGCAESDSKAEERGSIAVELCEGHGGVAALDDDIVVCRDQSVHQGEV